MHTTLDMSQAFGTAEGFGLNNENELLDGKSTDIDHYVHKKDLGEGRFGNVITVKNKLTRY